MKVDVNWKLITILKKRDKTARVTTVAIVDTIIKIGMPEIQGMVEVLRVTATPKAENTIKTIVKIIDWTRKITISLKTAKLPSTVLTLGTIDLPLKTTRSLTKNNSRERLLTTPRKTYVK
mgnify:CR=1 FL=1